MLNFVSRKYRAQIGILLLVLLKAAVGVAKAQQAEILAYTNPGWALASPPDVDSPAHLIAAYYDVLSGPATAPRDWTRFRSLFLPSVQFILVHGRKEPLAVADVETLDRFVALLQRNLPQADIYFRLTAKDVKVYQHTINVWASFSTYAKRADKEPIMSGVGSFQLVNDGQRYWIVQVTSE